MKDASAMVKQLARKQNGQPIKREPSSGSPQWFILSAGGIFAFAGANNLLEAFGDLQVLNLQDPVFGVPFRYLFLITGIAEFFVAWLFLFTNKRILSLGLVTWLVINFIVYRIGLWTMGWQHPWVFVGGLTDTLSITPFLADGIIFTVYLYLLVGSGFTVWFERGTAEAAIFHKMTCPSCGGRVEFPIERLAQKIDCPHCKATITLRKSDELLKTSCFFCKKHIEFPAYALGQKIACPHCNMKIQLNETI